MIISKEICYGKVNRILNKSYELENIMHMINSLLTFKITTERQNYTANWWSKHENEKLLEKVISL